MKLVYVAGPYRAPTGWEIDQNIQRARRMGVKVVKMEAMPVIPHANTAHFDGAAPDSFWLEGTLEMMRRCDAVITVGAWWNSTGTKAELDEAKRLGIPAFHSLENLHSWLLMGAKK